MKTSKTLSSLLALGLCVAAQQSQAITLSFANVTGGNIEFNGTAGADTFHFNPGDPSNQFKITASDGLGDSVNDMGRINGTFTIGAITISGGVEKAPVTGSSTIVIHDGVNDFTANVNWVEIQTSGTAGSLNVNGNVNLTSAAYGGSQQDLLDLASTGLAIGVVSFTFIPGKSLTQLTATGAVNTASFSGTLSTASPVPDGGATLLLFGSALVGLTCFSRSRKA